MNTYGDMVTLLLTFFVLLFAFSTISETKWKSMVASFSGNPGGTGVLQFPSEVPAEGASSMLPKAKKYEKDESLSPEEQREQQFEQILENIQNVAAANENEFSLEVRREGDTIIINFNNNVLFNSGSSDLRKESLPILGYVRDMLIDYEGAVKMIRIEGHTDDVPIKTARFRDNWELSTSRAVSVLEYMLSAGEVVKGSNGKDKFVPYIDTTRITASGRGEFYPVDTNDTEAGKQKNRRVEIMIEKLPADNTEALATPTSATE